jgi:hypothetical protein
MEKRTQTGEPTPRLYEAILHLRRLGHQVCRHDDGLHALDGAVVSDATLLEAAMTRFRRPTRTAQRASRS